MKTIRMPAHAKVNLSLDVIRRKSNGYHKLKMIMQEIQLMDIVTITLLDDDDNNIEISSNTKRVPTNKRNLVYSAYKLMAKEYNIKQSIRVYIEKNIPISAGLGGGSTDAAAVLKGLNKLWKLELTDQRLMELGVRIGADVPFCIMGGTALSEGIGERLSKLSSFKDKLVLLANPGIAVSTAHVFKSLDIKSLKDRPDIDQMIQIIENDDMEKLGENMKNVLESVTIKLYPEIEKIKSKMMDYGALGSLMSGSGATVFGIFDNVEDLNLCKQELEKDLQTVISTKTI